MLQFCMFMAVLRRIMTGQIPSVISELGLGKNLVPGRKSSIQISWLSFKLCQGSVLATSLPKASLENLQVLFFFVFFLPGVLFEVPRARNSDATTFLVQVTNIARGPESITS